MQLHVLIIAIGISILLMYLAHRLNHEEKPSSRPTSNPKPNSLDKVDITNQGEYR
jgi:hypothetical protein